ncbi:MAG TPA: ABC transporter permease subunit [Longimicrobiales bacterium]|nr:ABC transporter permease subunit [Longimicrobiales bacterium]
MRSRRRGPEPAPGGAVVERASPGRGALSVLLSKELRELAASRAYWLMLVLVGLLVGHAFITAVSAYAEVSGAGGGPAALAQGVSPLDGILVPTLGAYDLAAMLLLPFVAIRLVAGEKATGAWKLLLQAPAGRGSLLGAKALALLLGWVVAWVPGILALALWRSYGGHLDAGETLDLVLGHALRAWLTIGLSAAAAAVAESAAGAAIVVLGVTLGTWALDFVAAARGGLLQRLAAYTPSAALHSFEQGLLRLGTALVLAALGAAGVTLAGIWLRTGAPARRRWAETALLALAAAGVVAAAASLRASWDLSEDRRGSFSAADEAALRRIHAPLRVTVHLAAEDPRLQDLDRGVLRKLERVLPSLDVRYAAAGRTGLFEADPRYGEVWYELGGRREMSRSTTEPIVLEVIYGLAGITPPAVQPGGYPGYPLAARPAGAVPVFFVAWPLLVGLLFWATRRAPRRRAAGTDAVNAPVEVAS